MNNSFDNNSFNGGHSALDSLMQSLNNDLNQHDNLLSDQNLQDHLHPHTDNAGWDMGNTDIYNNSLQHDISSLNNPDLPDSSFAQSHDLHTSPLHDPLHDPINSGSDLINPDFHNDLHQPDMSALNQPMSDSYHHDIHHSYSQPHDLTHTHHDFHSVSSHIELHSSYSYSGGGTYVHIDKHGDIYLHKLDGTTEKVGYADGRDIYNSAGKRLGYLGNDSHIYKWRDDTSIGKMESGHIYRENGKEAGRADTDLEGAAHMFFVVYGGQYGGF